MSVGLLLLQKVIEDGVQFTTLSENGMTRSVFEGEEVKVYNYIEEHFTSYGELPSLRTVGVETGVKFGKLPKEALNYWINGVETRRQSALILSASKEMKDLVTSGDVEAARVAARQLTTTIDMRDPIDRVVGLHQAAENVLAQHDARQVAGSLSGVPFGFEYLDTVSDGAQGGDSVAIVGRPSVGKSYVILKMAMADYNGGGRPLVVSLEMTPMQCALRILALRTGVPAALIRVGHLSAWSRRLVNEDIHELVSAKDERPFYLLHGSLRSTVEDLVLRVRELRPTALYTDGAYMLRTRAKFSARWERVSETAEWLKMIATEFGIPSIATYQFNRRGPGSLGNIAFCLDGMTIITTPKGMFRIKDLPKHFDVWTGSSFSPALLIKTKKNKRLVVEFEDGSTITASPAHRFKVWDGSGGFVWKYCKRLQIGDRCVVFGMAPKFPLPPLPLVGRRGTSAVRVRYPKEWTKGLAELVGFLIGDGSTVSDQIWTISFDSKDFRTRELLARRIFALFGYPTDYQENKRGTCLYLRIMTKSVVDFFRLLDVGALYGPEKHVPASILRLPDGFRGAFLRGLFDADGSISAGKKAMGEIRYSTFSHVLANDVLLMLRSLGIDACLVQKNDRKKGFIVRVYRSEFERFKEAVGFVSDRKKQKLASSCDGSTGKTRRGRNEWSVNKAELLKISSVCPPSIPSKEGMFDLSVSSGHEFVANGIVVHNSDVIGQLASIVIGMEDEKQSGHVAWTPRQYKMLNLLKGREGERGLIRVLFDLERMVIEQDSVISGYNQESMGEEEHEED